MSEDIPEYAVEKNVDEDEALDRCKKKQKEYKLKAISWGGLHFFLGGLSVSFAAVIAIPVAIPEGWGSSEGLGAVVAVFVALSTFLRPDARAKKYNAARHLLRRARTVYEHKKHPLVLALNEADDLILQE